MPQDATIDWSQGRVHVYTGDGKGKTTAALGLALRAAGAGLRVYIAQFVKGMPYSEHRALQRFGDQLLLRQYGRGCFIEGEPAPEDREAAASGWQEVRQVVLSGQYDLVVLDELSIATRTRSNPRRAWAMCLGVTSSRRMQCMSPYCSMVM